MADTVRYFMEAMLPELDDLEEKGYFTKPEIREIVRKRENFEYSLKRKAPLKSSFLRYIEYESSLAELISLRKASLGIEAAKSVGDLGIVKRCHKLYERATKRFKGDLSLWLSWAEFCKASKSTRQLSKVLAKALQLHPTAAGLWSYAAAWEYDHNNNTAAARSLMQQALRVCKTDQQLWLEYFRLELIYTQKLHSRRAVLGIQQDQGDQEATGGQSQAAREKAKAQEAVLSGAVARLVVREAIERIPDSVEFRAELLEVLQGFSFPGVDNISQEIYTSIEADFGSNEEAWEMRARRNTGATASTSDHNPSDASIRIYEAAITAVSTSKMYDFYATFLLEQVNGQESGIKGSNKPENMLKGSQKKLAKRVLELYKRASEAGCLSEESALQWPRVALRCGRVTEALEAADDGTTAHPTSLPLWGQCITMAAQHAATQVGPAAEDFKDFVKELVLKAVRAVDGRNAASLWVLGLETFQRLCIPLAHLLQELELALSTGTKGPLRGGIGEAATLAVQLFKKESGIEAARALYGRWIQLPPAGGTFFHGLLDMELSESISPLPSIGLKGIFEAAVGAYGNEDTELWLRYARYDQQQGRGPGGVYWRATKELHNPDAFVTKMSYQG